jgi:hypothetical protein
MSHHQNPSYHCEDSPFAVILRNATPRPVIREAGQSGRRVALLERRSPGLVRRAAKAGVPITPLGIAPVFSEPRAYAGPQTDWIMALAAGTHDAVVPRAELQMLVKLDEMGIRFPLIYIAHEVRKERLETAPVQGTGPVSLDRATAARAVGPVPPPAAATMLADRLGRSSQAVLTALRKAAPVAGAIAAAPFLLAGAAAAALAAGLDPVVFGVIPAGPPTPGQPAAWYVLASWQWPSGS